MAGNHPLQTYRESRGLTREALGKELGVTGVTVGRWENGRRGVRKSLLPVIEQTTKITAAKILQFEREAAQ